MLPRGFSLVELVVVVVIIGLIAAIAIPRFGRASANAGDAALRADLKLLRDAIELYAADHNDTYPAYRPAGADALHASSAAFERQMTWYTAPGGAAKRVPDADHYLGPYLRKMPVLPVCANKGSDKVSSVNFLNPTPPATAGYGWEFCHYTGDIRANCKATEVGSDKVPYAEW